MTEYLTDPACPRFRVAQGVAAAAPGPWRQTDALPRGEVIWQEAEGGMREWVILTPDAWLVDVSAGKTMHERRMRATKEWVAEIRGRQ